MASITNSRPTGSFAGTPYKIIKCSSSSPLPSLTQAKTNDKDQGRSTKFLQGGGKMKRNVSTCSRSAHKFFFAPPPPPSIFCPPPWEQNLPLLTGVCTRFLPLKLNKSVFFDLSISREASGANSQGGAMPPRRGPGGALPPLDAPDKDTRLSTGRTEMISAMKLSVINQQLANLCC